jgi:hypothetical protein
MSVLEPGFYVKLAVCDADGRDIVSYIDVKLSTAREFYEQRLIPANVARTYESIAVFMGNASIAVTVVDALTYFARHATPRSTPQSIREPTLKNALPNTYDPAIHAAKTKAIRVIPE